MSNENWLGQIDASKHLYELVIPGSHDAGVYRDTSVVGAHKDISVKESLVKPEWVRCQSSSIYNQAMAGSRFFDCRVYLRSFPVKKYVNGKLVKEQQVPTLGHFFRDTKSGQGGGYGGSLATVINDAISFVRGHTSEFLILRFSHTKCPDQVANVLEEIYDNNGADQYILTGDVNIAQARLASVRGKVIMIFDSKFNKQRLQTYSEKPKWYQRGVKQKQGRGLAAKGMHLFTKYTAGKPPGNGLCTCGAFANTGDMAKVEKKSLEAVKAHRDHGSENDHLCFVYWQMTGGNVEQKAKSDTGTHAKMQDFLYDCMKACGNALPNVISHDFVCEESCNPIIRLNTERKAMMSEVLARELKRT